MAAQVSPILDDVTEASVRVGRTLRDKWHLDALIDVGGMAAVYAATHRNGMRGAVKILHLHRSLDPDITARFRREGYIANKVAHANAVRVLDDDVDDDGSVFLVMELLEGATLRERAGARGGRLPPDELLLVVDQLLDVLAVAHDGAIIHRDIKPENVFVTAEGQVKILDFGIARLYEASDPDHSQTVAGLPMGSPAFMSPEQARGRWDLVDAQSDLWSVGATMFTLLSGQDVHAAGTVPELLAAIFTEPAPSLAVAMPDSHPALVALVDLALQLRLADRWQDARTMQEAVREAYLGMFGVALPAAAPTAPAPQPRAVSDERRISGLRQVQVATTGLAPADPAPPVPAPRRARVGLAAGSGAGGRRGPRRVAPLHPREARTRRSSRRRRGLPTTFASPLAFVAAPESPRAPTSIAPPPGSAAPALRSHRRSVYDRRN